MRQVIRPEGSTIWETNRQIREYSENTVRKRGPKGKIVGYLMDGQESILICCCSNDIGGEEERPREDRGFS